MTRKSLEPTTKAEWLLQNGGRSIDDLGADEEGFYVLMTNGKKANVRVYLPTNLK